MTEQGNHRPKLPSQHYSNCTDVTPTPTAATPGRSKQGSAAEAPRARFGAVPVPAALRQHSNATESPSHRGVHCRAATACPNAAPLALQSTEQQNPLLSTDCSALLRRAAGTEGSGSEARQGKEQKQPQLLSPATSARLRHRQEHHSLLHKSCLPLLARRTICHLAVIFR